MFPQTIYNFTAVSKAHTAVPGETVLATTGSTEALKVTLPSVTQGGPVIVRKVDAGTSELEVVTADKSTIDGVEGTTGVKTTTQHAGWTFATDGKNWSIVAS